MRARIHPGLIWLWAGAVASSLGVAALPQLKGRSAAGEVAALAAMPVSPITIEPDIAALLSFQAFGNPQAADAPVVVGQSSVPGLTLLGVTLANTASASMAIISGGAAASPSYGIGAEILPGTILREVYRTHVVLESDGKVQQLAFAASGLVLPGVSGEAAGGVDLANLIAVPDVSEATVGEATVGKATDAAPAAPTDMVERLRTELNQDAQGLLDRLGLTATDRGYVVGEAADALLGQAGLLSGDVVGRVNGQPVGNIDTDGRHFDEVVASGQARVEVIRGEQTLTLTFPIP